MYFVWAFVCPKLIWKSSTCGDVSMKISLTCIETGTSIGPQSVLVPCCHIAKFP